MLTQQNSQLKEQQSHQLSFVHEQPPISDNEASFVKDIKNLPSDGENATSLNTRCNSVSSHSMLQFNNSRKQSK